MCYFFNKYIKNTKSSVNSFSELVQKGGYIQDLPSYSERCNDSIVIYDTYEKIHKEYANYIEEQMDKYNVDVLAYPTTKNEITSISNATVLSPSFTISPATGMPAISIPMGFGTDNLPYGIEFVTKANGETILYSLSNSLVTEEKFNVSELAPMLYDIDDDVTKLVELYTKNQTKLKEEGYVELKKDIQEFFLKYNSYENEEQVAISLLNDYNKMEIKKENQKQNMMKIGVFIAGLILLIFAIEKTKLKKKSRVKKKNYKSNKRRHIE